MTAHNIIFYTLAIGLFCMAGSCLGWILIQGGGRKPTPTQSTLPNGRKIKP